MTETTRPDARTADGTAPGERWLAEARAAVAQDPAAVTRAFALAGRQSASSARGSRCRPRGR
ncbi:hypothetical protein IU11_08025, partial [Cellulosimicrobium sp. MM]